MESAAKVFQITKQTLPNSLEAERAVIGGVLMDGAAIEKVLEVLSPDGSEFYHPIHIKIFTAMTQMHANTEPVDVVTLNDKLKDADLQAVGGISYIVELFELTPTAANIRYYARIVKEKAVRRWLIAQSNEVIRSAYSDDNIEEVIENAQRSFVTSGFVSKNAFSDIKSLSIDTYNELETLYTGAYSHSGLVTGFRDLDNALGGLQKGDLIILAGRPSMGKSSLSCQIATYLAQEGARVGYFSIEVGARQLIKNIVAVQGRISTERFRDGSFTNSEWDEVRKVFGEIAGTSFLIDDTSRTSNEIVRQARRMYADGGLDIIFIDHLQELRNRTRHENRNLEVDAICSDLKALAKELDIPVVLVSQLSRAVEARGGDCRPRLSDLRDSGSIEQKADVVMFVYREDYYREHIDKSGVAEIIIAKHRNGPTGTVKLKWVEEQIRFTNLILRLS